MKYDIDSNGYIKELLWGCNNGSCVEYEGEVPQGYTDVEQWADSAYINAYYINNGNLTLDSARQAELTQLNMLQAQDYQPIYYKDLKTSLSEIYENYEDGYETGNPIYLDNARNSTQSVFFTNVFLNRIDFFCQTKNMMSDEAETETISGITFTKGENGAISISGTATEAVEYNLSGNSDNRIPICGLQANKNYYLNLGGLSCELRNNVNGTVEQVYTGSSGSISVNEAKNITQIVLCISSGTTVDQTIYPMLELGEAASEWVEHHSEYINIDLSDYEIETSQLVPSETLCPASDLYPADFTSSIDYVYIMDGQVFVSYYGVEEFAGLCTFRILNGYNFIYTTQSLGLELNYKIDTLQEVGEITANWCAENDKTYIDGAKIYTGSITAQQLAADSVTAEKINVTDLQALGATIGGFTIGTDTLYSNDNDLIIDSLNDKITVHSGYKSMDITSAQLMWKEDNAQYGYIGVSEYSVGDASDITGITMYSSRLKSISIGHISLNNSLWSDFYVATNEEVRVNGKADIVLRATNNIKFIPYGFVSGWTLQIRRGAADRSVFEPDVDNVGDLGSSSHRWNYVYCSTLVQGSDLKIKDVIDEDNNKYVDLIRGLKPISYRFKKDGKDSDIHMGFGAQDIYKTVKELGMGERTVVSAAIKDTDDKYHGEEIDDKDLNWSVSYTELIAPLVYTVQKLYDKVEALEEVQNERRS